MNSSVQLQHGERNTSMASHSLTTPVGEYSVSIRRALGRGAFGTIYPATHKDGREVAAKQIHNSANIKGELMAFHNIDHLNVLKTYDVIHDEYNDTWIMMEFCKYGDLDKYFSENPALKDNVQAKLTIMCDIAAGLEYLHDRKIVHRDIKPSNVLITDHPTKYGSVVAKITDFGLSKYLDANDSSGMNSNVGTQNFKAPEFFNKYDGAIVSYNRSIDVFAAGLTFLSLLVLTKHDQVLQPRIEGELLRKTEIDNPIGLEMFLRHKKNQQPIDIVVESATNSYSSNMIRSIIYRATLFNPAERITAKEMHRELTDLLHHGGRPRGLAEAIPNSDHMGTSGALKIGNCTISEPNLLHHEGRPRGLGEAKRAKRAKSEHVSPSGALQIGNWDLSIKETKNKVSLLCCLGVFKPNKI